MLTSLIRNVCLYFFLATVFGLTSAPVLPVIQLAEAHAASAYRPKNPPPVRKNPATKPAAKNPAKKGVSSLTTRKPVSLKKSPAIKTNASGARKGVSNLGKSQGTRRSSNPRNKISESTQKELDVVKGNAQTRLKERFNEAATVPYKKGFVKVFTTTKQETYYRIYSGNNVEGKWLTKVRPKSSAHAQQILNLPPGNKATMVQQVIVPKGVTLERSRAAGGGLYGGKGGGEQFRILPGQQNNGIVFRKGVPLE